MVNGEILGLRGRMRDMLVLGFVLVGFASCTRPGGQSDIPQHGSAIDTAAGSAPSNPIVRYGLPYATLAFEYHGSRKGTDSVFIAAYGAQELRIINAQAGASTDGKLTRSLTLRNGANVTILTSGSDRATAFVDSLLDSIMHIPVTARPFPEEITALQLHSIGYESKGTKQILGLPAITWVSKDTHNTLYTYRGVIVGRTIATGADSYEAQLVSFDTLSRIDPKRFETHAGLQSSR